MKRIDSLYNVAPKLLVPFIFPSEFALTLREFLSDDPLLSVKNVM